MNYIDFTIAVSVFLLFFVLVIYFTSNYFSTYSTISRTSELRLFSEDILISFFSDEGVPADWHENATLPVKIGLISNLYVIPLTVEEKDGYNRTNEPLTTHVILDEDCDLKAWNSTLRLYDEDNRELNIEISNETFCENQFLKEINLTWNVNVTANSAKKFYLFFSSERSISDPNYTTLTRNTDSWIPNDGDSWTESTTDWDIHMGSGELTNDTTTKKVGNVSVSAEVSPSSYIDLRYNPIDDITGVSNDWYLDLWFYLDNTTDISSIEIWLWKNVINFKNINITNEVNDSTWYHFEKQLNSSDWTDTGFDVSEGIDTIIFVVRNSTPIGNRTIKIDGLHFKKPPLQLNFFPEEIKKVVSMTKFDSLKNLSYEIIRKTIGKGYKFRISLGNEEYGDEPETGNMICSETPRLTQFKNGSISLVTTKICVWK